MHLQVSQHWQGHVQIFRKKNKASTLPFLKAFFFPEIDFGEKKCENQILYEECFIRGVFKHGPELQLLDMSQFRFLHEKTSYPFWLVFFLLFTESPFAFLEDEWLDTEQKKRERQICLLAFTKEEKLLPRQTAQKRALREYYWQKKNR